MQNKSQLLSLVLVVASWLVVSEAYEMVETGPSRLSPNGRHVGVNVPGFFSMQLDTRGPGQGLRMTQSIMLGFVKINMDRVNGTDGRLRGPLSVKVAGITMYNNRQELPQAQETPKQEDGNLLPRDEPAELDQFSSTTELSSSPASSQESESSSVSPAEVTETPKPPSDSLRPEEDESPALNEAE